MVTYYLVNVLPSGDWEIIDKSKSKSFIKSKQQYWKDLIGKVYKIIPLTGSYK